MELSKHLSYEVEFLTQQLSNDLKHSDELQMSASSLQLQKCLSETDAH